MLSAPTSVKAERFGDEYNPLTRSLIGNSVVGGSLAGAMVLAPIGTSGSYRVTDVVIKHAGGETGVGGFVELFTSPTSATANAMRDLKAVTGFTWEELAKIFGVSRRSIHSWASGSRLNHVHAIRLERLSSIAAQHDKGTADATRAELHAPIAGGLSVYQQLVRAANQRSKSPELSTAALLATRPQINVTPPRVIEVEDID